MPDKYKSPWALRDFFAANSPDEVLSLSWEFRLKMMERLAKIMSDLHRKNRAYGYGNLSAANVLIQASDRYGLRSLESYPPIVNIKTANDVNMPSFTENEGELAKLDALCLGVLILELLTQQPLNGRKLPQLVGLLRRKGLGNLEISLGGEKLRKISTVKENQLREETGLKQKAKEQLVKREIIKEDLKRNDYNPEPESRMEEAALFRNELEEENNPRRTKSGRHVTKIKSNRNGSLFLQIKNSNRMRKTQMLMNKFFKNAQQSLKKITKSLNKRRKEIQFPKWANFQKVYVPRLENPIDEEGRVSRNLIRENDIIERKVDEELEKKSKHKKKHKKEEFNEYVMSSIIKDEVKAYLDPANKVSITQKIKKPAWLLNLHELILQLLTSVDDSRLSAKATRNWLLEVLASYEKSAEKHEEVKNTMESPDFQNMSKSLRYVKLNLSETMQRGDYVTNVHGYDLLYKGLPAEEILAGIKPLKGEILVYHSKDVVGELLDDDDEDNMSEDSHQPGEKVLFEFDNAVPPKNAQGPIRSSLLVMENEPASAKRATTASDTEMMMERDTPPIFGPKANKLLERMERQRDEVGEVLKPSQVARLFDEQKKMPHHQVVNLLKKAREIMNEEPNVLNIDAPVIVVGDIHGQYFDLRQVMKFCGKPKKVKPGSNSRIFSNSSFKRASRTSVNKKKRVSRKSKRVSKAGYLTKLGLRRGKGPLTEDERDKIVFNQEEFIQEMKEAEANNPTFSDSQAVELETPLTKALTLGRTIEGGKVSNQRDTMASLSSVRDSVSMRQSKTISKDKGKKFLFLGDYIDRGDWSCEVLFYLLSLKVHYPESVIMLRGNHECDTMAETYGFREECEHKYGREIYHRCVQVFYALPIACLVNLPNGKRFLGCHGGFSDKISSLDQLMKIERRREPGIEGILCDLLWSDPVPDNVVQEYNIPIPFEQIDFIPNETRGCAKKFGYKALEKFLIANDLVGIVRAHEAKEEGFQFHFQKAGTKDHLCITVFSAPNYMNEHGNKGAVLLIHKTVKDRLVHQMKRLKYKYTVDQILGQNEKGKDDYLDLLEPICYKEVQQPDLVPMENQNTNLVQQIEDTCPYMPTIIDEFYNSSLDILERYGDAQEQLEAYAEEQKMKKIEAEKELEETKKEKAKLKFQTQNGRRVWHSVKFGTASFKQLNALKTVGRSSTKSQLRQTLTGSTSSKFDKTLKRVNEQHPHLLKEKLMRASSKLEQMETKAIRAAQTDDDIFLKSTSSRSLGVDNIQTLKRGRTLSAGVSMEDHREIMKSTRLSKRQTSHLEGDVSEAEEDNNVVVTQIQKRQFMKRERIEIDNKENWLQILASWFSIFAGEELLASTLFQDCEDCVFMCEAAAAVLKRPDLKFYRPKLNAELSPFEVRRNLIVFQDCCKDLGIQYMFLIYDIKNCEYNYVLPSLIELVKRARKEKVLEYFYEPEVPESIWDQAIGQGLMEIPDDAKEEDLMDKGLEVGTVTFNGEERLMLQLLFLMIDIDDSGLITAESIIGWAREEGKLIRPEHATQVISAIDYDNDGAIGLRDFFQYAAKLKEEFLSEEFDDYEEEYEDGVVEEEEVLFNNQPVNSDSFEGIGDDIFNPTDAFDLSRVHLQMETNSEDTDDDIINVGL